MNSYKVTYHTSTKDITKIYNNITEDTLHRYIGIYSSLSQAISHDFEII